MIINFSTFSLYQSEQLIDSMYLMEWTNTPLSFKKSLIILMERCKREIRPDVIKIIPLNLDTFIKVKQNKIIFNNI